MTYRLLSEHALVRAISECELPLANNVAHLGEWLAHREGDAARRKRIRERKALRAPWVYVPNDTTHKAAHHRITLGGGGSARA